jgi:hypothetical protein
LKTCSWYCKTIKENYELGVCTERLFVGAVEDGLFFIGVEDGLFLIGVEDGLNVHVRGCNTMENEKRFLFFGKSALVRPAQLSLNPFTPSLPHSSSPK